MTGKADSRSDGDIIRQGFFEYVRDSGLNTNSLALAAVARLEAERDRYKAALEEIIETHGGYPDDYAEIARRALNGSSQDAT